MFERFNESARRALFFARYEASQLGGLSIETEHLLLGLARVEHDIVARLLKPSQASYESLLKDMEGRTAFREKVPRSVEIPFSAESKRVLQYAREESDRLGHSYIGTEHLFLGLLREDQSIAGTILVRHGFHLEDVRSAIVRILAEPPPPVTIPESSNAGVSTRIAQIVRSVERLTEMLPEGSHARTLSEDVGESLKRLKRHLRG